MSLRSAFLAAALAVALSGLAASAHAGTLPLLDSLDLLFDDGSGNTMPYRLYLPPDPEPGRNYPLVLFLHGAGERGIDNLAQVSVHIEPLILHTQSVPFASFLLAPQLPPDDEPSWGQPVDLTDSILEHTLANYNVDTARIYVTGLSLGGIGSYGILARSPDRFAAAVPLSAFGDPQTAPWIQHVPIWAFHGENDRTILLFWGQVMIDSLIAAGGSPLFTVVPGAPHNIPWSSIYADDSLYDWMFRQAVPEPAKSLLVLAALSTLGMLRGRQLRGHRCGPRSLGPLRPTRSPSPTSAPR